MSKIQYYLVGGAVRDRLLGRPVKDRDWVVTGATPEAMQALGFRPVGKDFPVFLHPKTHEEYALARTERKTARGYHGFEFYTDPSTTLVEDLQRRDLTINALAETPEGVVIDPYGGQADLEQRILRHVSNAFAEDPVRILRVARFHARYAQYGFSVAPETIELMRSMVAAGEVDSLVPERVWQELETALQEPNPECFIQTLRDCGALEVLFPEIERLFGVPQPAQHHPEIDTGVHTLMVLQRATQLSPKSQVRFAALTHDLGKGLTPADILPSHYGHEERSAELVNQLCERYRAPKHFQHLAELTARYHTHIHRAFEQQAKTCLHVLEACDAFRKPERFEELLIACQADSQGRTGFENRPYPQADFFRHVLKSCQAVNVKAIIQQGYQGEQIREHLHRERLTVTKKIISAFKTQSS
jgi:tRNA nucleotidyltransferase (CCA-adding enzyme)